MKTYTVLLLGSLPLTGCVMANTTGTYAMVSQPVLLGPVDHLGPGPALQTEATSHNLETNFTHRQGSESMSWTSGFTGYDSAKAVLANNESLDVRVDELETSAVGAMFGLALRADVDVEGKVVRVREKK
jgi:hypothetical protein